MTGRKSPRRAPAGDPLAALETSLAAARGLQGKVDALNSLALALRNRDPRRARALAEEAWRLARSAGYATGIAWGNLLRGFTRKQSGRFVDAFTCGREALQGFRELGEKRGEAFALRFIGGVYVSLLDLSKALDYNKRSLALFTALGDGPELLATLANTANLLNDMGDPRGALQLYDRALKRAKALGDPETELAARLGAGIAHRQLGAPATSLRCYRTALRLAVTARIPRREAEALILIGEHHLLQAEFRAALPPYERALALGRAADNLINQVNALSGLGEAALGLGDIAASEDHFTGCLRLGRATGNPDGKILGLLGLSGVAAARHQWKASRAAAGEALQLATAGRYADYIALARKRLAESGRRPAPARKAVRAR